MAIALKTSINTVSKWTRHYETEGLEGFKGCQRAWAQILAASSQGEFRADEGNAAAARAGRGGACAAWPERRAYRGSVHQLWQKNDLKLHRAKTFKLANDPRFVEKFWDVIGLYL